MNQNPVAWLHSQGNHREAADRPLDESEIARGWTEQPLFTAEQLAVAVAAEREACALACDSLLDPDIETNTSYSDQVADTYIRKCAELIRAR